MTRRRRLSPEEAELWQAVARTARPLHNPRLPLPDPPAPLPQAPPPAEEPRKTSQPRIAHFHIGERAPVGRPHDLSPPLSAAALRMDAKTHARMTRGKLAPEARIDLHGLTLAEAHPELIRFLLSAQEQGMRLVLVITGKGKATFEPVPRPVGALRHQLPHWLRLPPLSHVVLQVAEAHLRHGGAGAFYVYLRRR